MYIEALENFIAERPATFVITSRIIQTTPLLAVGNHYDQLSELSETIDRYTSYGHDPRLSIRTKSTFRAFKDTIVSGACAEFYDPLSIDDTDPVTVLVDLTHQGIDFAQSRLVEKSGSPVYKTSIQKIIRQTKFQTLLFGAWLRGYDRVSY